MTAFVWVYCAEHPPYGGGCANRWPVHVEAVATALAIAAASYPDAPPLAAQVILDCDAGECSTRLHLHTAATITEARAAAAERAGWFTVPRASGKVADHCQFHTEPAHPHLLPGRRRAAAPILEAGEEQLDLFAA
jgi:hypothetical protein